MSKVLVNCPLCHETVVAHGKVVFYHCGIAFLIKDCSNQSITDKIAANYPRADRMIDWSKNNNLKLHEETDKEREVNAGQNNPELRREGAQELGESTNPDNSEPVSGRADSPSEGSAETRAETEQLILKKLSEGDHA